MRCTSKTSGWIAGWIAIGAIGLAWAPHAMAATILGHVRDVRSGQSIEQADIELEQLPADGMPEATVSTDLFGFFRFDAVTAGTYRITATHAGYVVVTQTNTLAATDVVTVLLQMTPLADDSSQARMQRGRFVAGLPVQAPPAPLRLSCTLCTGRHQARGHDRSSTLYVVRSCPKRVEGVESPVGRSFRLCAPQTTAGQAGPSTVASARQRS